MLNKICEYLKDLGIEPSSHCDDNVVLILEPDIALSIVVKDYGSCDLYSKVGNEVHSANIPIYDVESIVDFISRFVTDFQVAKIEKATKKLVYEIRHSEER